MNDLTDWTIIHRGEHAYPPLLAQINDPPAKIFVRGNSTLLQTKMFAVVGSRDVSDYGRRAIETIVPPVAEHLTIVSGMALGADAAAHCAALENNRPTIAVLGCGVDDESIYPRSHIALARRILDSGGCIVSEYPIGERARPEYFPARNRIVAGMSLGVLIAEAARDSGTMITARLTLDYNRELFAVPGSIFSKLCAGTNEILHQGAHVVTCSAHILTVFGIDHAPTQQSLLLSRSERHVYDIIARTSCSLSDLITLAGLTPSEAIMIVSELELRGIITRSTNNLSARSM